MPPTRGTASVLLLDVTSVGAYADHAGAWCAAALLIDALPRCSAAALAAAAEDDDDDDDDVTARGFTSAVEDAACWKLD
jgi:hypothetical protein